MAEIRLGTLTNYLDLCDPDAHILYGLDAPVAAEGATLRPVAGPIDVLGTTADALWANKSAIEDMLTLAKRANRERRPAAERVMLWVRVGTTDWTYIDVVGGTLDIAEIMPTGLVARGTLTLACRPLFRGDAIQAQNLLTAPTDPTNAAWTATNLTATADDATAPDGSTTAGTLLETTTNAGHSLSQEVTKAATATEYTLSAYVKPNGRSVVHLSLMTGANGATAGYTLSGAGSVSSAAAAIGTGWTGLSAAITDAGGGWYRVSLTGTSDTGTTLGAWLALSDGSTTSYAGNASLGVRLWGMQVEEASEAGLLLIPTYHADTVRAAYTVAGGSYTQSVTDYTADPDNLYSGSWSETSMTETTGQDDPSGGTGASREVEVAATTFHYFQSTSTSVNTSATVTVGLYLKNFNARNTPTLAFAQNGDPSDNGCYFTVNLTNGTFGATTTNGTGYQVASRASIDMGDGWWWVKVVLNIGSTGTLVVRVAPNGLSAYAGNTANGLLVWQLQIVNGSTIDEPIRDETVTVDDVVVDAETVATGNQSGAWLYNVPGDAAALYRLELDDASSGVAVNRVHAGAWSGPDVLLGEVAPFVAADPATGASTTSGRDQVGETVATLDAGPSWAAVGTVALADLTGRRGSADVCARVRDRSSVISPPTAVPDGIVVSGGAYPRRLARVATSGSDDTVTTLTVGIPRVTPGTTLVLACDYLTYGGLGAATATVTGDGGLTWSSLWSVDNGHTSLRAWYVTDAAALTGALTVTFSSTVGFAGLTLVEVVGLATASPLETTATTTYPINGKVETATHSITTSAQAHEMLLSMAVGGGFADPLLAPTPTSWQVVSSVRSGAMAHRTVTATGTYGVTWDKVTFYPGMPQEQAWIVALASFKAASATASSITAGEWSVAVTAVNAAGNESLPLMGSAVTVPSTSSVVAVAWAEPLNGTADTYRVYRNHGSGWGYVEVTAPATSYVWTSESSVTTADPPTTPPPVAAWRLSVALPSGETLWRAQQSVPSEHANSTWEDVYLGTLPLPPVAAGEDTTPEGAVLVVEAAHLTGATVDVNGVWLYDSTDGQVRAYRAGLDATTTPDWVLDTNRDGVTSAWLRDTDGTDAGQPVVSGRLTLNPGNAQLVIRPEVAGGESDLVNADLRVSRVLVTPRYVYLRGTDG